MAGTGFGKTIVAAQIIKNVLNNGKSVVFIVDRIVLANQTSNVLVNYEIPHGVIQSQNERFDIDKRAQVCSIQTLKLRGCPQADMIIIDEAHVLHKEHIAIMKRNPDAYILGLTATPYAKGLGKHFDFHIEPVPVKKLIEEKYLVPFDIYGPSIADLSRLKVVAGDYTEKTLSEAYDKVDIVGDVVKTWQRLTPGKKTIVFGVNVAHIKHLVTQFQAEGISAVEINYRQTEEERTSALVSFTEGNTMVLCSVEVATKGFDCPAVEVAVLAVATKSMIKWTQTTGRALRIYPGKEKAVILDLGGNAERLGFPDDFEFEELDRGKKKKNGEAKKVEILPKKCPSCDFIKPMGVRECPACGFIPEFKKDVEVEDGELEKLKRKARSLYTVEEKQSFLSQLNTFASEHNFKAGKNGCYGWALKSYEKKFGCSPSSKLVWNRREPLGEEVRGWAKHLLIAYSHSKEKANESSQVRM
jgi:superfamily II DNA or RNA helicase